MRYAADFPSWRACSLPATHLVSHLDERSAVRDGDSNLWAPVVLIHLARHVSVDFMSWSALDGPTGF